MICYKINCRSTCTYLDHTLFQPRENIPRSDPLSNYFRRLGYRKLQMNYVDRCNDPIIYRRIYPVKGTSCTRS